MRIIDITQNDQIGLTQTYELEDEFFFILHFLLEDKINEQYSISFSLEKIKIAK